MINVTRHQNRNTIFIALFYIFWQYIKVNYEINPIEADLAEAYLQVLFDFVVCEMGSLSEIFLSFIF